MFEDAGSELQLVGSAAGSCWGFYSGFLLAIDRKDLAMRQAGSSQHLAKIFEMESIHLDKKIQYALSCLFDTEV